MTEDKLHCYVKSVKHDTREVTDWLKPVIVWLLQIVVVIVIAAIVFYLVSVTYLSIVNAIIPVVPTVMSFITQQGVYLAVMVGIDLCILYGVKRTMEGSDETLKELIGQIGVSLIGLLFWFGINALVIVLGSSVSGDPLKFYGWSYMLWESAINAIIIVAGIFLVRAYVRCEKIGVPIQVDASEGEEV